MASKSRTMPRQKRLHDAVLWTALSMLMLWPLLLAKWLITRPLGLLTLAAYVALATWTTDHVTEQVLGWLVAGPALFLGGWWLAGLATAAMGRPRLRELWTLHAAWRLRAVGRKAVIYKRRWKRAARGAGLVRVVADGRDAVPRIVRVRLGRYVDRLYVRMLDGQDVALWEQKAAALAHSLRSRRVRVRQDRPGRIMLEVATEDPLCEVVKAFPVPEHVYVDGRDLVKSPDGEPYELVDFLQSLPVGLRDDGRTWRLQLLGKHVLVAGSMGSGKGSVIWSTLAQLAPLIHEGLVEVWAADPKGGMELGIGRPLFARMETDLDGIARMLEEAADGMDARCDRFGLDGTRLHEPTRRDPLVLLVIDEIANLTAYGPKAVRERVHLALGRLLSKGRAPAYVVLGALQDPRKEVLQLRSLFNNRICLRVDGRMETNMVLGEYAWERGAACDAIKHAPGTEQGVGYVKLDDAREADRVRACWWSNREVVDLAARFPWRGQMVAFDEAMHLLVEAVGGERP